MRLAAGYRVAGDTLRVSIDSGGYRVEDALILRPDGGVVRPLAIEPPGPYGGSGLGIGIGVGGSVGSGGGVSIGTGVGVGSGGGGSRPYAVAVFPLAQAGPPPWTLHVKVVGIQPVVIVLPPQGG